jgi:putative transposase
MARSLRIEYNGALYHITSRGNKKENIFISDADRVLFLTILEEVCNRCCWICYSYCLMNNHYHLLIETPEGNISKGMRLLNGMYTQQFNRLHSRVGHVFQGRFKGILVEKENYLLELSRYIVLNPVRANMAATAFDWEWSSYRATICEEQSPNWLSSNQILALFSSDVQSAIKKFQAYVALGNLSRSPWDRLKHQIYLGTDDFVKDMQAKIDFKQNVSHFPKTQYLAQPPSLQYFEQQSNNRNECITMAYNSGGFSMEEIGNHFGLHYSRISRIVKNQRLKLIRES